MERPTMKDVARRSGVSAKSVSRVINGEPGVSAATAERILAVMAELGFRRNDLARNLRQGAGTGTVGLVLEDPTTRFYSNLFHGVESVARQHRSLVLTAGSIDADHERQALLTLCARRIDGLLVVPAGHDHSFLQPELRTGLPIVFLDRPATGLEADVALLDNVGGARAAVAHLLGQGHRRVGLIGDSPDVYTVQRRAAGYRQALESFGVTPDPRLVKLARRTAEDASAAAREMLAIPDPPTAFFAANNRATVGVFRTLRDQHRPCALVGFDDFDLADLLVPPVTVVAYDSAELGRHAAELLFARMAGEHGPPRHRSVPTHLVIRGSGEIPPDQLP